MFKWSDLTLLLALYSWFYYLNTKYPLLPLIPKPNLDPTIIISHRCRLIVPATKGVKVIAQAIRFVQQVVRSRINLQIPFYTKGISPSQPRIHQMIRILKDGVGIVQRDFIHPLVGEVKIKTCSCP